MQGEPAEAERWEQQAVQRAEEIGFPRGPFSLAFVKVFAAWNRRFMGRHEDARRLGEEVLAIGKEHGYALWTTLGAVFAPPAALGGTEQRVFLGQVIATLRLMGQESFSAATWGTSHSCTPRSARPAVHSSSSAKPSTW